MDFVALFGSGERSAGKLQFCTRVQGRNRFGSNWITILENPLFRNQIIHLSLFETVSRTQIFTV